MLVKLAATFGFILVFFLLPFSFFTYRSSLKTRLETNRVAESLDSRIEAFSGAPCSNLIKEVGIEGGDRLLFLGRATNLRIELVNSSNEDCTALISVNAATFEVRPDDVQEVHLPPGKKTIPWNLAPTKIGEHKILIQVGLDHFVIGLIVKEQGFPTELQSKILSWVSGFLGPMATLPFWIVFFRKRRKRRIMKEPAQPK